VLFKSFIHSEHLYRASSKKLLIGAPNSSMAEKSSLMAKKAGEKALGKIRSPDRMPFQAEGPTTCSIKFCSLVNETRCKECLSLRLLHSAH